jgi:hypothetical protein
VIRCGSCAARYGRRVVSLDDELRARGAAPIGLRTPVVAVGANASPGVVRGKMHRGGADEVIPLLRATVRDLRIGLSAHVGRPGFIPAAPVRVEGDMASVVVGWPDPEQLERLDETEPNYRRLRVPGASHLLRLDAGLAPDFFDLYESRWGVLAEPDGPLRLRPQTKLFRLLGQLGLEPWRSQPPADAVGSLAASERLRAELRDTFRAINLVTESGLRPVS